MNQKHYFAICLLLVALIVPGCHDNPATRLTDATVTPVSSTGQPVDLQNMDTVFMAVQKPLNVVYTGNNRFYVPTKGPEFQRELVREAFLIAARDEIGVLTRDELLGESRPDNDHTLALRFHYVMPGEENDGGPLRQLSFRRTDSEGRETKFLDYDFTLWISDHSGYMRVLQGVERLSREDFAQSLKSAGMKKFASPKDVAVDETETENALQSIDRLLDNLSLVSQYDAVRQTHQWIRNTGETPPLLQRLVRGYAQLYLLSEHHFLKTRFVFQSRALLYAQRIVAKYGEIRENLELRGAVFAYITYFELARESFAQADSKNPAADADATLSQWIEIARAYADYDFAAMETLMKEHEPNPLAKLVYYLMHEYTLDTKTARRVGRELSENFSCMRILDGIAGITSFDPIYAADGKEYTEYYDKTLSEELLNVKGLPVGVAETVKKQPARSGGGLASLFGSSRSNDTDDRFQKRKQILDSILATPEKDDACEMSWQALAHLIREESVIQIYHVARGIRGHNGDPASWLKAALPVYQGHPLEKVLRCLVRNSDAILPLKNEIASETPPYSFADITTYYLWVFTALSGQTTEKTHLTPDEMAMAQIDWDCYRDLYYVWKIIELNRGRFTPPSLDKSTLAAQLIRSTPHSPLSVVGKIDYHWQYDEDDVLKWCDDFHRFPSVLRRIYDWIPWYSLKSVRDQKIQLLRFIYEHSGTRQDVSALTTRLIPEGKSEEALEILEHYLTTSDAEDNLSRYVIAGEIARILMQEKRFDEALKYAKLAGSCYSASGLRVLAECHEVMGNFAEAQETFYRLARNYSTYKDETLRWAIFCQRVDSPEWEKAKSTALSLLENDQNNNKTLTSYTEYLRAANVPLEKDVPDLLQCFLQLKHDRVGWPVLMDAIAAGDKKRTDDLFSLLMRESRFKKEDASIDRTNMMYYSHSLSCLFWLDQHSENPGNIDEDAIDYVLQLAQDADLFHGCVQHVLCPLAMYYDALGNGEKAVYYARQSLASTEVTGFPYRNIAVNLLKKYNPDFSPKDYADLMKNEKVKISPLRLYDGMSDLLCHMILQEYGSTSSEILVEEGTPGSLPSGMLPLFDLPYAYCKVKSLKFRGRTWNEKEIPLKCIFDQGGFTFRGIGCDLDFSAYAEKKPGEPTMIKLTNTFCNESFRGLIVYNGDNQPIKLCLNLKKNGSYPKNMEPAENSNCVVFELEKMDMERVFPTE